MISTDFVGEVIGIPLSAIASPAGKQVGMWVDTTAWIELSQMGDGVAQMLGLITQLCMAEGKLFLIEEIENDIHPEGLKALLRVIEARSTQNQFVLSTHNNIVVRHLGALADTRIYDVTSTLGQTLGRQLATTSVKLVSNDVRARVALLTTLGYELSDFDLYDGWLVLEEASAERIIRDYLIPWFTPSLRRVRTVAARGTGDIDRTFEALNKLVLFTHLQDRYRDRVRVLVDNEPSGFAAVKRLRDTYTDWPQDSFGVFTRADFELYYPEHFLADINSTLALRGSEKRAAKRRLLMQVLAWIDANPSIARDAFAASAADVIVELRRLETSLATLATHQSLLATDSMQASNPVSE